MKLFTTNGAPSPERVTFFLKEKGKLDQIELVEISLMEGEHRSDDYKKINPLRRVPTLQLEDGTLLGESRAICTYLEGEFPTPNLMGESHLERAQIEMWSRRVELMLMVSIAGWFRHGSPRAKALEPIQISEFSQLSETATKKAAAYFDKVLSESPYLAGDRFTIADIELFVCMGFGRYMKYKAWEEHPNLSRWLDEMKQRPMAS